MVNFEEGYEFFQKNTPGFIGADVGDSYIKTINTEINNTIESLNSLEGFSTASKILKGDVAEFWHSGTFNINAAIKDSSDRVFVNRSYDFASPDISSNFGKDFSLKYYYDGKSSAQAQSMSIFQRFKEYQSKGGLDNIDNFLKKRGYKEIDSVLNDPIYSGQIRIIPRDQLEEATKWLERMIKTEELRRPEQVHRYKETLSLLKDIVSNDKGVESVSLSKNEAETLAALAKQGKISAEKLGLTTENLVNYEYIMQQSFKAGLTAATISVVLKVAPEIFKSIDYLIKNGYVDKEQFKKIGFSAITGSTEGFVRGSISAALTTGCKAGLLGATLKNVDPSIIGAVTVITMNVLKNAYDVSIGHKTKNELTEELIRDMYVSAWSLIGGGITQTFVEIPVLGYMIGSFLGSIIGSFTYNIGHKAVLSFCVDSGFTMFGLVEQDYTLPKEIIREIGIETFDYESFEISSFEPETFLISTFEVDTFKPETLNIHFLRRGVIGVSRIGYI